jgi:thiol-disulfide isomerase/thioredoxin
MMIALLATLLLAQPTLPVRPIADAPRLAAELGQGKPVVLHFWATWCGACVAEFPRIRDELHKLSRSGVQVALVSIDSPKDAAKVQQFLERFQLQDLPALILDAPDPEPVAKAVGDKRWDGTLPATFVFDARAKLSRSFIGRTNAAALDAAARKVTH